jgi:prepilin-type N-terminal cleavage/methylation domain-containing protein
VSRVIGRRRAAPDVSPVNRVIGRRRGGFTLAEMIMAIAMLALFSVFIVQMFVKADQLTRKARCLDQAVACASGLADLWRMDDTEDVPSAILDLRQNRAAGREASLPLDSHFQICDADEAIFVAVLTIQPGTAIADSQEANAKAANAETAAMAGQAGTAGLWRLTVVIGCAGPSDSGPLYSLQAGCYFPQEVSAP